MCQFMSLPTRYGKLFCYGALPVVVSVGNWVHIVLVVSPLTALMKDQVAFFTSKGLATTFLGEEQRDRDGVICGRIWNL